MENAQFVLDKVLFIYLFLFFFLLSILQKENNIIFYFLDLVTLIYFFLY